MNTAASSPTRPTARAAPRRHGSRPVDRAADTVAELLERQAALFDAQAEVLEHRTDLVIAQRARDRVVAELVGLEVMAMEAPRGPAGLRALLATPDAARLRAVAERYRAQAASIDVRGQAIDDHEDAEPTEVDAWALA
jgi:hypothetical protein